MEHAEAAYAVAFSPNGKLALTGSFDKTARLWEVPSGKLVGSALLHNGGVWQVAFTPDGKRVATSGEDGVARLWDVSTSKPVFETFRHSGPIRAMAISPNGRLLVTGSWDHTARIWSTDTGMPIGKALQHKEAVYGVAFAPDSRTVLTGSEDGTAQLWDAGTGRPVGPALPHPDNVYAVAFSPNGKAFLTGGINGMKRWTVPSRPLDDIRRIVCWTQVITGMELDQSDAVHALTSDMWRERRRQLETLGGPPILPPTVRDAHDLQAHDSEQDKDWFAATFHLGQLIATEKASGDLYARRGKAYAELEEWHQTLADCSKAIELKVDDAKVWYARGRASAGLASWKNAIADYTKALEKEPEAAALWLQRSLAWAMAGDQDRSRDDFSKAFSLSNAVFLPKPNPADYYRSKVKQDLAVWRTVSSDLLRLSREKPRDPLLARSRGLAHLVLGEWNQAIEQFSIALENKGETWETWFARGAARWSLGQWDKVTEDFSKAIELSPGNWLIWYFRGGVGAWRGKLKQATDDFSKAIELRTNYPDVWNELAYVQLKLGDVDGYRKTCKSMLERFGKTDEPSIANVVAWTCALAPTSLPDYEAVIRLAELAVSSSYDNVSYRTALGAILYRAGRTSQALQELSRFYRLQNTHDMQERWLFLAMAHHRLGHAKEAQECFERAGLDKKTANAPGPGNIDRSNISLLRQEVMQLIKAPQAKPDK
jgi:tetratricopeptide (TPR) repeat protein